MIGISALTEFSSDDSEDEPLAEATKEAKESEAFALYNQALLEQRSNNVKQAEHLYHSLLQSEFLEEVELPKVDGEPLVDPAAILKYSAYKNLGNLALERGDQNQGVEYLLEAVCLDSTDVSLWYKIGQVAVKLMNLPLANISLREGLRCNPNHWPSLDCIITVLYTIGDYSSCLFYVARILEKDARHLKAHAFKAQILKEDAYHRRHAEVIFKNCPESVHNFRIKKDDLDKFVNVALEMREERRKLAEIPPLPVLKFRSAFKEFSWRHLGEQLTHLYDYISQSDPHISFGCRVDLSPSPGEVDSREAVAKKDTVSEVVPGAVGWASQGEGALTPMEAGELSDRLSGEERGMMGNLRLPSSSESHTQTTDVSGAETEEVQEKNRKSHKKKRGIFGEPAPGKRRSARVRNTEKKKDVQETINYHELLQRFLPSTLIQSNSEEHTDIFESPTVQPQRQSASATDLPDLPMTSDLEEVEVHEVEEFLKQHAENGGIVSLMRKYLVCMSKRFHLNWPRKLSSVYIEVYHRMRKHITIPAIFFQDDSDQYKRDLGLVILVYMELFVDKWRGSKANEIRWGKFVQPDMVYLEHLSVMEELMKEMWPRYPVRVYWMRAHYFVVEGKTAEAVNAYDVCHHLLVTSNQTDEVIYLPNIHEDKIITKDIVENKKDMLRRTQSHKEITKLFEEENYERVVDILLAVMDSPHGEGDEGERMKQKMMLMVALSNIEDHKNLVICFYKILKEFWEKMQGIEELPAKTKILKKLDKFFEMIVSAPSLYTNMFQDTHHKLAARLSHLLIDVIAWIMRSFKAPEEGVETHLPTVLPWIVLYYLIKSEEDKMKAQEIPGATVTMATEDSNDSSEALLPAHLMFLDTAHENLGRKSWCVNSSGAFLKLTTRVLLEELDKVPEDPLAEDLQQSLEQCLYCLYGHPHRRAKAKHLQDHGVEEVPLTWEYGKYMFSYFKPKMLPEFDGYKTSSMSGDLENLFLRITKVIPADQRPEDSVEKIHAYIDGASDDTPVLAHNIIPDSPVVSEIFYLLADYYFKNKEFGKANKFYIHDICFCPNRLDSWAGLALAKSGRLELKLNSCDAKAEGGVYKQGMGSLRCFHRALEIDQSNRSLWIEYGSFAYILQSHASRQLKQQDQIQLSEESIEGLKVKQAEMLTLSEDCFRKVKDMGGDEEGEEWLIHYMLGKIAEKRGKTKVALDHYLESMDHLYDDGAKFPKKISYHNPPDLALESLEMYFRIHAAILKVLEKGQSRVEDIPFSTYEEVLHLASIQPFVKRQEKKLSELSSDLSTDEQESTKPQLPILLDGSELTSPPYVTAPQDHDYARHKTARARKFINYDEIQTDTPSDGDIFSGEESATNTEDDSHTSLLQKLFPHAAGDFPLLTKQSPRQSISSMAARVPRPAVAREADPKEGVPKVTKEKEGGGPSSEKREEDLSPERRFQRLVTQCLNAMNLCLQRFCQHYKSLYRIAHWYLISQTDKNLEWCYDLLLGNPVPWQQLPHMPAPALFGEHNKTKNIFQGIWRIPIADIDRSGSFSWHMYRSVTLLIKVLEGMKDESMLLQLASKLARTPEQGKKFLRDSDRPHLALRAFHTCERLLDAHVARISVMSEERKVNLLMRIWQTLQTSQQFPIQTDNNVSKKALVAVYKSLKDVQISDDSPLHEQAAKYCQQVVTTSTVPQGTHQSEISKGGRPSNIGSPVRAPAERPPFASFLERLNQLRSPESLGLGAPAQPKKSPDTALGSSFMMSNILAPDPERRSTALRGIDQGAIQRGPLKTGPNVTKGATTVSRMISAVTSPLGLQTGVRDVGSHAKENVYSESGSGSLKSQSAKDDNKLKLKKGSVTSHTGIWTSMKDTKSEAAEKVRSERNMGVPSSRYETSRDSNEPVRLVEGDGRKSSSLLSSATKAEGVPKYSNPSHTLETGVGVAGLASSSGPGKKSLNVAEKMRESKSENLPSQQEGKGLGIMTEEEKHPEIGKSRQPERGGLVTGAKPTDDSQNQTGDGNDSSSARLQPPPAASSAPMPNLGQHLDLLLRKVRTGLKVTDKSRWKKLTSVPSGNMSVPARATAPQREMGEGRAMPVKHSSQMAATDEERLTTRTGEDRGDGRTHDDPKSTDSKRSVPLMSEASDEERARFDAILHSLKSSEGTEESSTDEGGKKTESESSAAEVEMRRPDELADILDSLKRQDSQPSRDDGLSSRGLGLTRSSSVDEERLQSSEHLRGASSGEKTNTSLKRQRSEEESYTRGGAFEPFLTTTGMAEQMEEGVSKGVKPSKVSSTEVASHSQKRSSQELAEILSSLKRPKLQASGQRRPLKEVSDERPAGGTTSGNNPSRAPSSDVTKKRSQSYYVNLLNSLKRRKIERSKEAFSSGADEEGKSQFKRSGVAQGDIGDESEGKLGDKVGSSDFEKKSGSSDRGLSARSSSIIDRNDASKVSLNELKQSSPKDTVCPTESLTPKNTETPKDTESSSNAGNIEGVPR